MASKKKIIRILCLGAVYFMLLGGYLRAAEGEGAKAATPAPDDGAAGVVARPEQEFVTEGLRDPFRDYFNEEAGGDGTFQGGLGSAEPVVPLPPLTVQGIISGGRINQAIINNKIVKTGETIDGVLVTNIGKDGITVFYSNKSYKISSPAADILQDLKKKPEGGHDEK